MADATETPDTPRPGDSAATGATGTLFLSELDAVADAEEAASRDRARALAPDAAEEPFDSSVSIIKTTLARDLLMDLDFDFEEDEERRANPEGDGEEDILGTWSTTGEQGRPSPPRPKRAPPGPTATPRATPTADGLDDPESSDSIPVDVVAEPVPATPTTPARSAPPSPTAPTPAPPGNAALASQSPEAAASEAAAPEAATARTGAARPASKAASGQAPSTPQRPPAPDASAPAPSTPSAPSAASAATGGGLDTEAFVKQVTGDRAGARTTPPTPGSYDLILEDMEDPYLEAGDADDILSSLDAAMREPKAATPAPARPAGSGGAPPEVPEHPLETTGRMLFPARDDEDSLLNTDFDAELAGAEGREGILPDAADSEEMLSASTWKSLDDLPGEGPWGDVATVSEEGPPPAGGAGGVGGEAGGVDRAAPGGTTPKDDFSALEAMRLQADDLPAMDLLGRGGPGGRRSSLTDGFADAGGAVLPPMSMPGAAVPGPGPQASATEDALEGSDALDDLASLQDLGPDLDAPSNDLADPSRFLASTLVDSEVDLPAVAQDVLSGGAARAAAPGDDAEAGDESWGVEEALSTLDQAPSDMPPPEAEDEFSAAVNAAFDQLTQKPAGDLSPMDTAELMGINLDGAGHPPGAEEAGGLHDSIREAIEAEGAMDGAPGPKRGGVAAAGVAEDAPPAGPDLASLDLDAGLDLTFEEEPESSAEADPETDAPGRAEGKGWLQRILDLLPWRLGRARPDRLETAAPEESVHGTTIDPATGQPLATAMADGFAEDEDAPPGGFDLDAELDPGTADLDDPLQAMMANVGADDAEAGPVDLDDMLAAHDGDLDGLDGLDDLDGSGEESILEDLPENFDIASAFPEDVKFSEAFGARTSLAEELAEEGEEVPEELLLGMPLKEGADPIEEAERAPPAARAASAPRARRKGASWRDRLLMIPALGVALGMRGVMLLDELLMLRRNWWIYCDVLAAIILTIALAMITARMLIL